MTVKCVIYTEKPAGFRPAVEAAGCFCKFEEKLLFAKRHPEKAQGNTWSIPGGKIERGESPRTAIIREMVEETGLDIDEEDLETIGTLYCRLPYMDYIFHLFVKEYRALPEIDLHLDEHLEYRWVTFEEALELSLIPGGAETLHYYREKCS